MFRSEREYLAQGKEQIDLDLKFLGLDGLQFSPEDCVIAGSYTLSKLLRDFIPNDVDIWITKEKYEKYVAEYGEVSFQYSTEDALKYHYRGGYGHSTEYCYEMNTVISFNIWNSLVKKIQFIIIDLPHGQTMIEHIRKRFDMSMCLCFYDGNELIHDFFEQTVRQRVAIKMPGHDSIPEERYLKYVNRGFTIKDNF